MSYQRVENRVRDCFCGEYARLKQAAGIVFVIALGAFTAVPGAQRATNDHPYLVTLVLWAAIVMAIVCFAVALASGLAIIPDPRDRSQPVRR